MFRDFGNGRSVFKSQFCHLQAVVLAKLPNILKPQFSFYKLSTMVLEEQYSPLHSEKMCGYKCNFLQCYELLLSRVLNLKCVSRRENGTIYRYQAALSLEPHNVGFHSLGACYVSATRLSPSHVLFWNPVSSLALFYLLPLVAMGS